MEEKGKSEQTQKHYSKKRYLILFFDCMIGYGCYYNIDLPSALQDKIEGKYMENCSLIRTNKTTCCEDCVGLTSEQYNQLYAVFLWLNSALSLPMGLFVDRVGNRTTALISTLMAVLGSTAFSIAMINGVRHTKVMFPLMVIGRAFLGAGAASIRLVQDRLIAFWFPDRLELVFGMIVCFLRLGNVTNFLLSANLSQWLNLQMAVWSGTFLCGVGFLSAIFLAIFDFIESKKVNIYDANETKSLKPCEARKFPLSYWFIVLLVTSYYSAYIPFVANGCEYIQQKFHYSETIASYINGASYDVAVIACPIVGVLLNRYFRRYTMVSVGSFLLLPTYILLILHPLHPIITTCMIGVVYSLVAVSIWPSVAKTVPLKYVGTANGIACTCHGLASGVSSILIGLLLDKSKNKNKTYDKGKWDSVFYYLLSCSIMCFLCAIALVYINRGKKHPSEIDKTVSINTPILQQEKEKLINGNANYGSMT